MPGEGWGEGEAGTGRAFFLLKMGAGGFLRPGTRPLGIEESHLLTHKASMDRSLLDSFSKSHSIYL